MNRLSFSFGPVQSFVAQSRRTRDLWASSWLLSWLSSKALGALLGRTGTMAVLPHLTYEELRGLVQQPHAVLPNRFEVEVDDPAAAAPQATKALMVAWHAVADRVYERFVKPVEARGCGTKAIWDRQIDAFWEISWVAGGDDHLMDRRKNWRLPEVTIEAGDCCTLMSPWQELSGWSSGNAAGEKKQKCFWDELRSGVRSPLDLDRRERLGAVALIKRLFPTLDEAVQRDLFGMEHAWSWPSTLDIATTPWKERLAGLDGAGITSARDRLCKIAGKRRFQDVRSEYLIEDALRDSSRTADLDAAARASLIEALQGLLRLVKVQPPRHYAILVADGDRIGATLRTARATGKLSELTEALVRFSGRAAPLVQKRGGHCVYSGGDDVLALLPVTTAMQCASDLSLAFDAAFKDGGDKPTLSAAVLFAHYRVPLSGALRAAHELLEDVAKEQCGRATLAVAVHKHSGLAAQFGAPWVWWREVVNGCERLETLDALVAGVDSFDGAISRSALYKLQGLLERLGDSEGMASSSRRVGSACHLDATMTPHLSKLFGAELLVGRDTSVKPESAMKAAEVLVDLMRTARYANGKYVIAEDTLNFSPIRLAIFLANEGLEA